MNPVLIDFGIVKIYWYSIMILAGLIIGGYIILKETRKNNISENHMNNLILFLIVFGIIGARIYYVMFNLDYYSQNIIEVFKIWEGGLAIHGAIIVGILFIIYYAKKHSINTFRVFDIMVVGLIIGQAVGRWGNFFNGEAHGSSTTLEFLQSIRLPNFIIDGMNIYGTYYHPTFLYESLWCLLGLVVLLIFRRLPYTKTLQTTGLYLIWYGIGRFFIEQLRTDSLMFNQFKVAQIVSVSMIVIGIIIIIIRSRGSKFDNRYSDMESANELSV